MGLAQWRGREHKAFWFVMRKCFHCRLQVYPLHSTVTLEEQNGVFLKPVHGFRKVKTLFFSHFSSVSLFLIVNIPSNTFSEPVLMTFLPQWSKFSSPSSYSPPYRWFFPPTLQRVQWLFQMSNMVGILICTLVKFYLAPASLFIVITVIDFCLARILVCDQETNYQSLCLSWASKSNCNQRRGTTLTLHRAISF